MVPGLRMASTFFSKRALDVEILDHGFDDPVAFGELFKIVLEVPNGHEPRQGRLHEGGGLGFLGSIESGGGDLVPRWGVGVGRNDIEEITGNTGVGKMCGDAGAHGSGAEDGNFINALHHEASGRKRSDCSKDE